MFFDRLRPAPRRRPRCAPETTRHRRLSLDPLEGREVPATFAVTTALDVVNPADGKLSLREAVSRANARPGLDTIVLPAGVFKITIPGAGEDGNLSGDFDIHDTVTIQGAGAGLTVIDGQQLDRVFDVLGSGPSSIKVVLQGLTVRNGNVIDDGGGIRVGNADLVVRDCVVSGSRASLSGGGISSDGAPGTGNVTLVRSTVARNLAGVSGGGGLAVLGGGRLTIQDSSVRRNISSSIGGGINAGTVTLTNSTVTGNSAVGTGGGIDAGIVTLTNSAVSGNLAGSAGGGILAHASVTLTNSTVRGNSAGGNGGGIGGDGTATLTHSIVSGNTAATEGGGIRIPTATLTNSTVSGNSATGSGSGSFGGGILVNGTATLTNCTVSDNSADFGGGIWAARATLTNTTVSGNSAATGSGGGINAGTATLTNSTVSGNSAGSIGGGIAAVTALLTNATVSGNTAATDGGGIWATEATLTNCTIAENLAHTGGGLFCIAGGSFNIRNTIVAQNLVDFIGTNPDVSGDFTSGGHNLIGDGAGSAGFGVSSDIVGTAANPIDPRLGPLANNGGRTKTHALLAGSPAIDRGDNAGAPATDQRAVGFPRKKDGNGDRRAIVDIGAYER